MSKMSCPRCEKPFAVPAELSATARVKCPHCGVVIALANAMPAKPRWFYARDRKKHGPYTWEQLQALARRGEVRPDDMVLQEGSKQWVRAATVRMLFASAAAAGPDPVMPPLPLVASIAPPLPARSVPARAAPGKVVPARAPAAQAARSFPWLLVGLASVALSLILGIGVLVLVMFLRRDPAGPLIVEGPARNEDKKYDANDTSTDKDLAQKKQDAPKKDDVLPKKEEKKKAAEDVKKIAPEKWGEQFEQRFNQLRQKAGLGRVTLDAELSRGCLAHARYLARNVDPGKASAANVYQEEVGKPGYSEEGQRAGQASMVAFAEPLPALEEWMGRLMSRLPLLNSEMQRIGLGYETNARGDWICVLDALRGRGEAIVVYPAPRQEGVPLAFSGGPEVPDAKAAAGYPITVTFPAVQQVSGGRIELNDDQGKPVEGWLWTPAKPASKAIQANTLALIPKGLLRSNHPYQVQASAQVDGKAWKLAWSFTTEDDSDSKGQWAAKALAKVNVYRASAGLPAVALDEKLSRGCLAHARYLVLNADHPALLGLKAHDEDLSLPGASEEGRQAGKASDIAIGDYEPLDGVDAWMATLYHRVPILEPHLRTVGFGCARGRRMGWITVVNVVTGRERSPRQQPVLYPAPEQTEVPLNFPNGGEEPNPIPEDTTGRAGYPITAFFPENDPLKSSGGKLTNARGDEIPCWFSNPEKPANSKFALYQGNTVCLIPKEPLPANTLFQVRIQGQRSGAAWEKQWKFTTGAGLSTEQARRQVLQRLNQARAHAGLSPVVLDDQLSKGCQWHAEYLVKNAETLLKRKASVNDEDPDLPGFTDVGARAGRQADVFTNAPVPVTQIDDLLATFSRRVHLLDPALQRIGLGCSHDIGRGWRCVLDLHGGKGDARVILYPAPQQEEIPCRSTDRIDAAKATSPGFPITVIFPRQSIPRNVQVVLTQEGEKPVEVWISSPEKPFQEKMPRNVIAVHPLSPLQAGQTYSVTLSAIINAMEWRQTWQFTTAKAPRP